MKEEVKIGIKKLLKAGFRVAPSSLTEVLALKNLSEVILVFIENSTMPKGTIITIDDLLLVNKQSLSAGNSFERKKKFLQKSTIPKY